ncbi:ABC transporter ATP-binding protein [Macrococcus brunensis]|uniref:ABC transporter ATP-binding protein n=1 Tax=Macrococcus brunensis TaxID=198483 RepID=A0A4R6BDZ9_9STAP|nr:ABC transporter ATP-binding protein [Macrococcus brunensis]TDL98031.1 ABC transporter ATP-binding protein [Macrococcus brunensis]ULG74594.1 ABC transporter ATP-binding protein [Macrococcus brunensis]
MTEIIINDVSKSYHRSVLHNIDVVVEAGMIHGFIGPSGSGKTTLTRMIAGLESPSSGSIYINDIRVPNLSLLPYIGYMAQSDALYMDLSGYENLKFFTQLFNMKKEAAESRIIYAADLVNLTADLQKKVRNYSGGMKRRLALATALLHEPDILILDEPTVGIDPALRSTIWSELQQMKADGRTILMTTHVMDEATRCDALSFIKDGTIIASGTPHALLNKYNAQTFDEVFIRAGQGEQS